MVFKFEIKELISVTMNVQKYILAILLVYISTIQQLTQQILIMQCIYEYIFFLIKKLNILSLSDHCT